jgi:hypothetical protein
VPRDIAQGHAAGRASGERRLPLRAAVAITARLSDDN